jgi:hypothetical protein
MVTALACKVAVLVSRSHDLHVETLKANHHAMNETHTYKHAQRLCEVT